MATYHAIVAHDEQLGIGYGNKLPWTIPDDLIRFKKITTGHIVIMGRKTYESIPAKFRPLEGRINIVMSTTLSERDKKNLYFRSNIDDVRLLVDHLIKDGANPIVYIIGGETVYRQWLSYITQLEVTLVTGTYRCDSYFPKYENEFKLINSHKELLYSFLTYRHL